MVYTLCKVQEIPATGTRLIEFFGRTVHVYHAEGKPVAVANVCMHFGGPLDCVDGQFVCQWHQATFDMATGRRTGGPAPGQSRLMYLSTRVDGDNFNYVWGD
jgi:nitrite reductase/ring-hydroxylating ferredoxin subunit